MRIGDKVRNFFSVYKLPNQSLTVNENVSSTDHASEIRLPDCSNLAINRKNDIDVIVIYIYLFIYLFIEVCRVSLVKFSYWSKFHVHIITGSGVMTIFICKGFTRNLESGNTHV